MFVRFTSGHDHLPPFYGSRKVLGMHGACRRLQLLFQGNSRVVPPALIDEIKSAVRRETPRHGWDCVDDEPEAIFAPPELFFRTHAFCPLASREAAEETAVDQRHMVEKTSVLDRADELRRADLSVSHVASGISSSMAPSNGCRLCHHIGVREGLLVKSPG